MTLLVGFAAEVGGCRWCDGPEVATGTGRGDMALVVMGVPWRCGRGADVVRLGLWRWLGPVVAGRRYGAALSGEVPGRMERATACRGVVSLSGVGRGSRVMELPGMPTSRVARTSWRMPARTVEILTACARR